MVPEVVGKDLLGIGQPVDGHETDHQVVSSVAIFRIGLHELPEFVDARFLSSGLQEE